MWTKEPGKRARGRSNLERTYITLLFPQSCLSAKREMSLEFGRERRTGQDSGAFGSATGGMGCTRVSPHTPEKILHLSTDEYEDVGWMVPLTGGGQRGQKKAVLVTTKFTLLHLGLLVPLLRVASRAMMTPADGTVRHRTAPPSCVVRCPASLPSAASRMTSSSWYISPAGRPFAFAGH